MKAFYKIKCFVSKITKLQLDKSIYSEIASINATMLSIFFAFVSGLLVYENQKTESLINELDGLRNEISKTMECSVVIVEGKYKSTYVKKDSIDIPKVSDFFCDLSGISLLPQASEDYEKGVDVLGERLLVLISYIMRFYPYCGNDGSHQVWKNYDEKWARDVMFLNAFLNLRSDSGEVKIRRIMEEYDRIKNKNMSSWLKGHNTIYNNALIVSDFFQKNRSVSVIIKELQGVQSKLQSVQNNLKIKNHIQYYLVIFLSILLIGVFVPLALSCSCYNKVKWLNWAFVILSPIPYIILIITLLK